MTHRLGVLSLCTLVGCASPGPSTDVTVDATIVADTWEDTWEDTSLIVDAAEVGAPTSAAVSGTVAMRRLTRSQYQKSVRDVLGQDLEFVGQLEPDQRVDGLVAVGATHVTVTPIGFEQYEAMAYHVAEQALDEAHREANVPCVPAAQGGPDDACAEAFIRHVGRRLFRRPLGDAEVASRIAIAAEAAETLEDFYSGLQFALASLLSSPSFLFRVPSLSPSEDQAAQLTGASVASRLSYALWDSTPDDELLDAAEDGTLLTPDGLLDQVARMLQSERLDHGIRAFFSDVLSFDRFDDGFHKDGPIFPPYNSNLISAMREQTLMTIVDHLAAGRDYRELFTSRRTFLNRQLATLYGVPLAVTDDFVPFEFAADSPRVGLLTHGSLMALYAHPGRSSATLRGEFVRTALLCHDILPPPGDVDFSLVEQANSDLPTLRDRVEMHMSDPACAGCHALTDPIGLGLEQFDGIGAFRTTENGAVIDPSGELDGAWFSDPAELGEVLSHHPALVPCMVTQLYKALVGRSLEEDEASEIQRLADVFAASGYNVPVLWSAILGSPAVRWAVGLKEHTP